MSAGRRLLSVPAGRLRITCPAGREGRLPRRPRPAVTARAATRRQRWAAREERAGGGREPAPWAQAATGGGPAARPGVCRSRVAGRRSANRHRGRHGPEARRAAEEEAGRRQARAPPRRRLVRWGRWSIECITGLAEDLILNWVERRPDGASCCGAARTGTAGASRH